MNDVTCSVCQLRIFNLIINQYILSIQVLEVGKLFEMRMKDNKREERQEGSD